MVFVETSVFTARVTALLSDEEYAGLQDFLASNPDAGPVIQGTGGLRKVRWASGGKGKRGGSRVIYYHASADSQIRMLLIYEKAEQEDLTAKQKAILRKLNEGW